MAERDPSEWMWRRARNVLEAAERLERRMARLSRPAPPSWVPSVDVFETAEEVWVLAAVPGVAPAQIEVAVEGGRLVLSGVRTLPASFRRAAVHRLEIPTGYFERRVDLPPGSYQLIKREHTHGCLALGLRKVDR